MKRTGSLLLSIRDCALGVPVATLTLIAAWSVQSPQANIDFRSFGIYTLLVAMVMTVTALPISYLARKLPLRGSAFDRSMVLAAAGMVLGPMVVFLCTSWFPGAEGILSETLIPFTLAAGLAGIVTGGMTGYTHQGLPPRPVQPRLPWKPSLGYRPHVGGVQRTPSRTRINP